MVTGKSPILLTTWTAHGQPQVMQVKKCQCSHNLMKKGDIYESWPKPTLKRHTNGTKTLWTSLDERWILKKKMKCDWTSRIFGCYKFLGPFAGPFKVLEKKILDIYKLELLENLKVHPTFHVSLFKPISHDASTPNQEHNSRPPPDLIHNELEFKVEAMLKSRQLRGRKREYLVKWKGYHPIETSWVNKSDMEHAQETIKKFHNRSAKKQKKHRMWWGHHLSFSGAGYHTNVPHQIASEIKAKLSKDCITNIKNVQKELSSGMDKWNFLV